MAKKQVIEYFVEVQNLYFEMLNDAKDFDEALQDGHVTEEQVEQAQLMLDRAKDNYERLAYILMLLNQPNRKKKVDRHINQNRMLYDHTGHLSKENTLRMIKEDLALFKEYIKKEKNKWV